MLSSPRRSKSLVDFQTPAPRHATDSDLEELRMELADKSKTKRVEEIRRGVEEIQQVWRCERALSMAKKSTGDPRWKRRLKITRERPAKRAKPSIWSQPKKKPGVKPQEKPRAERFKIGSELEEDPIGQFSEVDSDAEVDSVSEVECLVVPDFSVCDGCGRRWDGLAQCMCDYDTDDESEGDGEDEDESEYEGDNSNKEN